jgi:hypothetical protein
MTTPRPTLQRAFDIEAQRRRTRDSARSLKRSLDEACTGTGVCEPDWTFTPTVGTQRLDGRPYLYDDDSGLWTAATLSEGLLIIVTPAIGLFLYGELLWKVVGMVVRWVK